MVTLILGSPRSSKFPKSIEGIGGGPFSEGTVVVGGIVVVVDVSGGIVVAVGNKSSVDLVVDVLLGVVVDVLPGLVVDVLLGVVVVGARAAISAEIDADS